MEEDGERWRRKTLLGYTISATEEKCFKLDILPVCPLPLPPSSPPLALGGACWGREREGWRGEGLRHAGGCEGGKKGGMGGGNAIVGTVGFYFYFHFLFCFVLTSPLQLPSLLQPLTLTFEFSTNH